MEIRHLRHFVAVAEELHFARAADRLGIEQSPLSQSIRNLESELGVKLFQRTTRRTWLTYAGMNLYRDARRILRDIEALRTTALSGNSESSTSVRLALGEDLAGEQFTRLLFELEHHDPKVELTVRELLHADAARLVRDGGSDVAITLSGRAEPQLRQLRGWSERLMVVAPTGHDFAERSKVSLRDLAGQTLALPSSAECPGYLGQIEGLLDRYGVRVTDRRDVKHWNTAVSFAATGHAIALCPVSMVHVATSVVVVPLEEEDAELVTFLLHREDDSSSAVSLVLKIAAEVSRDRPFTAPVAGR